MLRSIANKNLISYSTPCKKSPGLIKPWGGRKNMLTIFFQEKNYCVMQN